MATAEHMAEITRLANATRIHRAAVKRDLRSGSLTLATVMQELPDALLDVPLIDIIRWSRHRSTSAALSRIGAMAVRDGVNLMIPLGLASQRSRTWVAQNGTRYWRPSMSASSC